jgi:uncharacterized protein YqgV (UPF0045/DUF77 family)
MVRAEFTVFPFRESGALPPHAQAAVDAATASGLEVDVGPLSNVVEGDLADVLDGLRAAEEAAFAAGADRFTLNLERVP